MSMAVLRGPLAKVIDIESLGLSWGKPEAAGNGEWVVRKAPATPAFWDVYRAHKDALNGLGYGCQKKGDAWFVTHFARPDKAVLEKRSVERDMSRAAESNIVYPAPDGLTRYPYQNAGISYCLRKPGALIGDAMGLGKALAHGSSVLTSNGWVNIENIKTGDKVFGRNGKPARVTGVYPQGERECYRVKFRDGFYVDCDADHLWSAKCLVMLNRGKPWRVFSTKEMVRRGACYKNGVSRFVIPIAAPAEMPERKFYLSPYFLGALIGDGHLSGDCVGLSAPEDKIEIEARCMALMPVGITVQVFVVPLTPFQP